MTLLYFAYGSNMNPARMRQRGLHWRELRPAVLKDFALCFDKRSSATEPGHACFRRSAGAETAGILYELTTAELLHRLDHFEHTPINYSRELFPVMSVRGCEWSWTYVANAAVIHPHGVPERSYLNHLLAGREWLPNEYWQRLLQQTCFDS